MHEIDRRVGFENVAPHPLASMRLARDEQHPQAVAHAVDDDCGAVVDKRQLVGPGLDLERAMWMLPARERFTKEARALRLEAAELAAKGRALSSHPAQPDIEDVEALVRELSGALPATVSHAAGPMHHLVEGGTALNPALQTPVDTKRQGSMTPVYED